MRKDHLLFLLLACAIPHSRAKAFQTAPRLLTLDPIPKREIRQRLGLRRTDPADAGALSIGAGRNMGYALRGEREVVCAVSGAHQGVLCAADLSGAVEDEDAESIANNRELVSQVILSGSLAASIRNQCREVVKSMYYLPYVITLEESLMVDEMRRFDFGRMLFSNGGLETNEVLVNLSDGSEGRSVILYSCNVQREENGATSDVYVLPLDEEGKVWRFSVVYKVAPINLRQIRSFGQRDSATPLRPDVRVKGGCH